jgi:predicted nuclease of predicted toxin-antitoxin system
VGLENAGDPEIFDFARKNDFTIVTFDSDFVDLNALYGTPPRIIWLNTGNLTTKSVSELIMKNLDSIGKYLKEENDEILELIKAP